MQMTPGTENAPMPEPVEQQWFIDRFQELFAQGNDQLLLVNLYKELPITHPAVLVDIKGAHVELETSELQLAAICQCKEVYIRSPLLDCIVQGKLAGMDIRRSLVRVGDFSKGSLDADNRDTVRVRLKMPLGALINAGGEKIKGVIDDLSVGGSCIKTLSREGLKEGDNNQIEFELQPGSRARFDCTVVKIRGNAPPYRCSFRFNHTTKSEELLSTFVYDRQREILRELRETL